MFVVLYLWQGVLGKPHLDELVASIGHIVLGAIPCGDLGNGQKIESTTQSPHGNLFLATTQTLKSKLFILV